MSPSTTAARPNWIFVVIAGWLVPGAGHFLLKRTLRGAILAASVVLMFLLGLMMRGPMFQPDRGDLLTTVIYVGGFLSHVVTGIPFFLATAFGYNQPDVAGHVYDYGAKFLVGAGLLNVLAMVDAYEIATGKKD
jgi:hypothetical protein